MQSGYPTPIEWRATRWVDYVGIAIAGVIAIVLFTQIPYSVSDDGWLQVSFFATAGLALITLALFAALLMVQVKSNSVARAMINDTGGSVIVRAARFVQGFNIIAHLSTFAAGVILSLGLWSGHLNLSLTGGQRMFFPIAAAAAALFSLIDLGRSFGQTPIGDLVLTPTDLTFKQTSKGKATVRWDDIDEITPIEGKRSKPGSVLVTVRPRSSGAQTFSLDARWPSIGAPGTYWLIRFYRQHPELRSELADHRSVDRIRTYGLLDSDESTASGTTA